MDICKCIHKCLKLLYQHNYLFKSFCPQRHLGLNLESHEAEDVFQKHVLRKEVHMWAQKIIYFRNLIFISQRCDTEKLNALSPYLNTLKWC